VSTNEQPDGIIESGMDLGTPHKILTLLYLAYSMACTLFGGIITVGYVAFSLLGSIMGLNLVPVFITSYLLQGFIIMILGYVGLQVTFGMQELDAPSFSWTLYVNLIQIVVALTLGWYGLPFIALSLILIGLLFTSEVRSYWYTEWTEDMGPRMKETKYSLHLLRKSPLVVAGVIIIVFMVSVAIFAPFIAPYGGEQRIWADARAAPGAASKDPHNEAQTLWVNTAADVNLLPTVYSGGFTVFSNETETSTNPWIAPSIQVTDTADELVNVTIRVAVYQLNYSDYLSMTPSQIAPYFVGEAQGNNTLSQNIILTNETGAYTWTLSFAAAYKQAIWQVDVELDLGYRLPPYPIHIWGCDNYGGDIYSRIVWGAQTDIRIALEVVAVAISIGAVLGAAAGYFGGKFDELVMRVTDVFFAFPGLVLAMAIVMALGVRSLDNIALALMVTWWPAYARLVRGQVLSEREKLYVEAARSVGASDTRILLFHIIPNTIQPVIVQATMDIGGVLLTAAGLSYIGFGPPAGTPEWGLMIANGQNYLLGSPWMSTFPGLAILITALAFNLVGDGIRDILDPKLRRR
jgi:peptide/nickel transport system permease protein